MIPLDGALHASCLSVMSCADLDSSFTPNSNRLPSLLISQITILIHLHKHLYTGEVTFHLHLIKEHSLLNLRYQTTYSSLGLTRLSMIE